MLALLLIIPLLLGIAISAFAEPERVKHVALAASIATLLLVPFCTSSGTISWLGIGTGSLDLVISTGALNLMLIALVAFIAPFIFFYSYGYMSLPSEQKRYYSEMLAFETAMLLFAMSGSFVTLFIAWEFLSMTSYLLIGFWYDRERAVRAARKVISIIMIGDFSLLGSMALFFGAYGTLNFSFIINSAAKSSIVSELAVLLLLVAVFTKSAQFPFHEWLADAMEGPTPVSAMLHSTTMVKAGVFAVMVLFPLILFAHMGGVLIGVGILTALIATLDAMREQHIKKVLAYSTVQELSLMLVALGAHAFLAAVYFFIAQSFYKALLFFSAGSVMTATNKEHLHEVSGMTSNRLLLVSTAFGALALAGFIPFDGFFASIGISSAFTGNIAVYALISLISMLTSFYIFRWLVLCSRPAEEEREKVLYESLPKSMLYSGFVLAVLALLASVLFFFAKNLFGKVPYALTGKPLVLNPVDISVELAAVGIGSILALRAYRHAAYSSKRVFGRRSDWIQTSGAFNAAYALFAGFFYAFADGIYYMELYLNSLFDYIGALVDAFGNYTRRLATGELNVYVGLFVAGFALLLLLAVFA